MGRQAPTKHPLAMIVTCVLVLVAVSVAHAVLGRAGRSEHFSASDNSYRAAKNNDYYDVAIKYFFSDGSTSGVNSAPIYNNSKPIFFFPTWNDVVTKLFLNDSTNSSASQAYNNIQYISCRDMMTLQSPSTDCSQLMKEANQQPLNTADCQARILDFRYIFVKTCVLLPVNLNKQTATLTFTSMRDYATKFYLMSRPLFVQAQASKLFTANPNVDWNSFDATALEVPIGLDPVTSENITDTTTNGRYSRTIKDVASTISSGNDSMREWLGQQTAGVSNLATSLTIPLTIWYMYPHSAIQTTTVPDVQALTLYLNASKAHDNGTSPNLPNINVTIKPGQVAITSRTGTETFTFDANATAKYVVLTRTTNMAIACVMDNTGRISMRYYKGLPYLQIGRQGSAGPPPIAAPINSYAEFMLDGAKSVAKPLAPATNYCVPNFADVAIRLGCLKG